MNIAVIIPDRGDRKELTENCIRMLHKQTLRPKYIQILQSEPEEKTIDITRKYRHGVEYYSKSEDVDVIAFIENDDWYAPDYFEYMMKKWEEHGSPELFGINYSIYYHLKLRKYFVMRHAGRASAMNTFIKRGAKCLWPKDDERFVDMWLWKRPELERRIAIEPNHIISVGMKGHGVGMHGGYFHTERLEKYINDDNGFLQNTLDEDSFEFFNKIN
jgi:hypothetical protein